jgi:hypothetical protein
MRKLAVLMLLLAVVPAQAWALNTDDLLATIAMPLAVAAVSNVAGVPSTSLADLVTTLNQANVPPTRFVEVIRFVPVALVDDNGQPFVAFVREQTVQGVTGDALVDAIVVRLRSNFGVSPVLALNAPATTVVFEDDFIPPVVLARVTRVAPSDPLSLIALPLAVAAVADIAGMPQNELANLVAALNQANVPPPQVIEVLRFVPVALVIDNGQPFVQFVQQQTTQGVTGPALVTVIERRLQTFFPAQTQITIATPAAQPVVIDQNFIPPVVVTRVAEVRAHPHGGPPGQLKKQLGLQTGAEVVHGQKPGRNHGKREAAPSPMISASPPAAKPAERGHGKGKREPVAAPPAPAPTPVPVAAPPAKPPGKEKGERKAPLPDNRSRREKDMERIESMRKISIAIAALTLILTFGCKNKTTTSTSYDSKETTVAQQLSPEELGELGAKIKQHPEDAQKLLSEKGLNEQSFEQAVRKVAEDPEASKRYAAAYKKAS